MVECEMSSSEAAQTSSLRCLTIDFVALMSEGGYYSTGREPCENVTGCTSDTTTGRGRAAGRSKGPNDCFSKLDSATNAGNVRERADITNSGRDRRSAPAHTPKTPLASRQDPPGAESHRGTDREPADREKEQLWLPRASLGTRYTTIKMRHPTDLSEWVTLSTKPTIDPCREWS